MKVLMSTIHPLSREKIAELTTRLGEFLAQPNPGVLVLPAGVSVHILPSQPVALPSVALRKNHKEQQP